MHSCYSRDSVLPPQRLVERCIETGLNCIAVTDHNAIDGAVEVRRIAPFAVIIGEEVYTSEGEIIGLFLEEKVPRGLSPLETVNRIKDQGGLVSIPHPFDRFRSGVLASRALEEVLPYVDMMEVFNARNNLGVYDRRARAFAIEHGLLAVCGSDAHTAIELGRTYVEIPEFDGTPDGLKRALAQGTVVGRRTSPLIHVATTLTKVRKRLLGPRKKVV